MEQWKILQSNKLIKLTKTYARFKGKFKSYNTVTAMFLKNKQKKC